MPAFGSGTRFAVPSANRISGKITRPKAARGLRCAKAHAIASTVAPTPSTRPRLGASATNIDAALASPIRTNGIYYHYDRNAQGFPIGSQLPNTAWSPIPNNDLSAQLAANPLARNLLKTLFPFTPGVNTPNITWLRPDGQPEYEASSEQEDGSRR